MTQDHKVPTQNQLDAYVVQAKSMRAEVLAALGKRLFHLPVSVTDHLTSRTAPEPHANIASADKSL